MPRDPEDAAASTSSLLRHAFWPALPGDEGTEVCGMWATTGMDLSPACQPIITVETDTLLNRDFQFENRRDNIKEES